MKSIKLIIVMIALLCLTCNNHQKINASAPRYEQSVEAHLFIEQSMPSWQKLAIRVAAERWQEKTRGAMIIYDHDWSDVEAQISAHAGGSYILVFQNITSNDQRVKKWDDELGLMTLGITKRFGNRIATSYMIADRLMMFDSYVAIAMHEIGHGIDLSHVNDKGSIMSRVWTSGNEFSTYDLLEFCEVHQCVDH